MSLEVYAAYLAACLAITILPGPTVTLIVANSLTHGTRAGLLNVAGTQVGLGLMMTTLVVGLASVVEAMGFWFDWLRLAGAVYLAYLGWKLIRSSGEIAAAGAVPKPRGGFFLQGLLVMLSNPKALVFFGAFIPQFVDPAADPRMQVLLLGATAMAMALFSDGAFAVLTGRAGRLLTRSRVRLANRIGGGCLIGGGLWLAFARAR